MVPKSERFEMRLDEEILARVDRWRAEQPDVPSRAEGMRRLVELGLAENASEAVRFSDGEKLIILMMRDLYKHLKLTRAEIDPEFVSEVIWGGHYWAAKWRLPGVFHDQVDKPQDLRFVLDVLGMWDQLERAHEGLPKKEKALIEKDAAPLGKYVEFPGFDGNNETAFLVIADFLVNKMERFSRFAGRDLNSHMPTLDAYRRMLDVFSPMRSGLVGGELGVTQIIALLEAQLRPERRTKQSQKGRSPVGPSDR